MLSKQLQHSSPRIRRGFRVVEVPIIFADRVQGTSKMDRKIVLEAFWKVWRIRFDQNASARERSAAR